MKLRIEIDAKAYDVEVEIAEEDFAAASAPPRAPGTSPPRPPAGAARTSAPPTPGPPADPERGCTSPIAGLVVRVLATVGQTVAIGDPLVVLEAMKMESSITAPKAGSVARILVQPGDAVKVGQTLVELS